MVIYVNSKKYKMIVNGIFTNVSIGSDPFVNKTPRLLSSDGYILKDVNGVYLIPKEDE